MTLQVLPADETRSDTIDDETRSDTIDPPGYLSPSGASTYEQCAKKWRWRYIDHLADPPGEAALVGSFAHRVLELLMQLDPTGRTKERAREIAKQQWPDVEVDSDFVTLSLDADAARGFRWKAWKAIEKLWTLEAPAGVEVRATEQKVEAVLAGVPFRGVVDRLDVEADGLVVTDYKSGNAPVERYRKKRLPQVLLYAAAISESTGVQPVRARLFFLGQKHAEVSTEVTPKRLDEVTGALAATWESIDRSCTDDNFPTGTGPLCGWCPYLHMCDPGQAEVLSRYGSLPGST